MKKLFILLILAVLNLFICAKVSVAGFDLPWSTTFNCADWITSDGGDTNCDGLVKNGDGITPDGKEEQITIEANYPNGGGGKGQRHWLYDGTNFNTGGIWYEFNTPQAEYWIRFYVRFENGFKWSSYHGFKLLYFYDINNHGNSYFMICKSSDRLAHYNQLGDHVEYNCENCGWLSWFPSGSSDGTWHFLEVHLKSETVGQSNGMFQVWNDGVLVIDASDVNYGLADNELLFWGVTVGSNAKVPDNGRSMYVDFDDIAISTTGYIGPISSVPPVDTAAPLPPVDTAAPLPPTGLIKQ